MGFVGFLALVIVGFVHLLYMCAVDAQLYNQGSSIRYLHIQIHTHRLVVPVVTVFTSRPRT